MSIAFISLLVPLAFLLAGGGCAPQKGRLSKSLLKGLNGAGLSGFLVALISVGVLISQGAQTNALLGSGAFALSFRLDMLSVTMLVLVSFIGWIVLRFASTYLDGEARQGPFLAGLALTLAGVLILVQSGDLITLAGSWIAISLGLRKLLLFYSDRVQAQRAARKNTIVAALSGLSMMVALSLLIVSYQTSDIASILAQAREGSGGTTALLACAFLALSAILTSAQFPTHGWLSEVMEAPTPVSALLHAGVINAGGFLLIRFGDVMLLAPGVLAALVMIGGLTAVIGGLAMLAQPAVKTSLAWSTIAQMGFMIMQCGFGLFHLALLHIIAHSLYKAHAFLSSGSAVENIAKIKRPGPVAIPDKSAVLKAFASALLIYGAIGLSFGFMDKSPQAIALGAILIFGVAYLIAQGLADAAPRELTKRTALYSLATTLGYFALQSGAQWLSASTLPSPPVPGALEWALMSLAIISFGLVAFAQSTFPLWSNHPAVAGLRVHLANGLYANAIFDQLAGNYKTPTPPVKK